MKKKNENKVFFSRQRSGAVFIFLTVFCVAFLGIPRLSIACDGCGCDAPEHPPIHLKIDEQHAITRPHIIEEFEDLKEFIINPIWPDYIRPAWPMMTEQLVVTAMEQAKMIGMLLDAKQQLEVQMVFQKMTAEAHQNYHPSHTMCVMGTNIRSLAEAERNYEFSTFVLSQRSIDRQMGNMNSAAARGEFDDHCMRMRQFRARYCDIHDNNDHMNMICNPDPSNIAFPECRPPNTNITEDTKNKDVSFSRTVDRANTLDIDFYTPSATPSEDEQDIFALASNLYSHDVMFRMPETALRYRNSQDELLDMRTIIAKRSVAEHSFNTIVGMKALSKEEATILTQPYMKLLLETIGIGLGGGAHAADEIAAYLGDRPSYYAQMELLTKHIFQSPDFFVNLYDEPADVERQGVALQAIGLMQDFDTWQSYLRTEAMLSVILELELLRLDGQVVNQMNSMRGSGIQL